MRHTRGHGVSHYRKHKASWKLAEQRIMIRPCLPTGAYLSDYGHHRADLCTISENFESLCFWAVPIHDEHGRDAMRAICELRRLGYHGVGSIKAFQRDAGSRWMGLWGRRR